MKRAIVQLVACVWFLSCSLAIATADDAPAPQTTTSVPAPAPQTPTPAPAPAQQTPAPAPGQQAPAPAPAPSTGPTVLGGRVTDILGKPIPRARVYVLPRGGGRLQTVTDRDGHYSILLADQTGAYSIVIAVSRINTYRQVLVNEHLTTTLDVEVETDIAGGEVIRIVDSKLPPPAVPPKPNGDHERKSLPYSPQAMERDAWARAFLLLDIDETGHVTRLKLLKRPGFDLDQIAIDEAFKLEFDPARDAQGHPIRTYIVWDMEWPSWGWLVQGGGTAAGKPVVYDSLYGQNRLDTRVGRDGMPQAPNTYVGQAEDFAASGNPEERSVAHQKLPSTFNRFNSQPLPITPQPTLSRVPCAGSGPLNLDLQNRAYRDCSRPDMSIVDALPWITRANAKTALAVIDSNKPQLVPGPRRSRVPPLIATGVTALFAVGLGVSFVKFNEYSSSRAGANLVSVAEIREHEQRTAALDTWNHRMLEFAAATVVSGAVTAVLWGRSQTRESFSVQPSKGGGTVSYGGSF